MLPAVFALLEAAVEVLAVDADRDASTSVDEAAPQLPASCALPTPISTCLGCESHSQAWSDGSNACLDDRHDLNLPISGYRSGLR